MTDEKNVSKMETKETDLSMENKEKKDLNRKEELKEDLVEALLEEQSRNQIRSDYRRSLGNEYRRRYLD